MAPPPAPSHHPSSSTMRALLLAALCAATLPLLAVPSAAQVGILGGVPGDAQATNKQFPSADRARLIFPNGQYYYTIPLNGARNYNFYYVDQVSLTPNQTFLGDGPWRIEYATALGSHAAGSLQGRDDRVYQPFNPSRSGLPYDATTTNLNSADVYFGDRNAPLSALAQNPANPVPGYAGALGIQGLVRVGSGSDNGVTVRLLRRPASGGTEVLLSTLKTNGNGFYSFYYGPGDNKQFIPPTPSGFVYIVRASNAGHQPAATPTFVYRPDANKGAASNQPVANRNYFVVGAREFDAGAGQPTLFVNEFTLPDPDPWPGPGECEREPWEPTPILCPADRVAGATEEDVKQAHAAYLAAVEAYELALEDADRRLAAAVARGEKHEVDVLASAQAIADTRSHLAALTAAPAEQPAPSLSIAVFPNPVGTTGTVRFSLDEPAAVSVHVYDALGRRVAEVAEGRYEAGLHSAPLFTSSLPAGPYVVRLLAGGAALTERITVVR